MKIFRFIYVRAKSEGKTHTSDRNTLPLFHNENIYEIHPYMSHNSTAPKNTQECFF